MRYLTILFFLFLFSSVSFSQKKTNVVYLETTSDTTCGYCISGEFEYPTIYCMEIEKTDEYFNIKERSHLKRTYVYGYWVLHEVRQTVETGTFTLKGDQLIPNTRTIINEIFLFYKPDVIEFKKKK